MAFRFLSAVDALGRGHAGPLRVWMRAKAGLGGGDAVLSASPDFGAAVDLSLQIEGVDAAIARVEPGTVCRDQQEGLPILSPEDVIGNRLTGLDPDSMSAQFEVRPLPPSMVKVTGSIDAWVRPLQGLSPEPWAGVLGVDTWGTPVLVDEIPTGDTSHIQAPAAPILELRMVVQPLARSVGTDAWLLRRSELTSITGQRLLEIGTLLTEDGARLVTFQALRSTRVLQPAPVAG
ncbi:MAG: hypothetical protein AAF480_15150 [Actinomycetota bacterium]